EHATNKDLSWFSNPKYHSQFTASKAGAILVNDNINALPQHHHQTILILHPNPYHALALISHFFYPRPKPSAGIDKTAKIGKNVKIPPNSYIGANVVIEDHVRIGEHVEIRPCTYIAHHVEIGANCVIGANCSIEYAIIGHHNQIHAGVRIGTRGFGFDIGPNGIIDIAQTGRVLIGNHCEIGANTTIDRGMSLDTVLKDNVRIDNLVHIGHNVIIGDHCVIAGCSGIAGSTTLHERVMIGGHAGLAGHLTIAPDTKIAAKSGVIRSIKTPGRSYAGTPAIPSRQWFKVHAWLSKKINSN
ncbi:MAG: UDP-3-O-(3-hydroxymyristoyl)glucosamine N-acyltransferase, partial [Pseudomonadota bacterium]